MCKIHHAAFDGNFLGVHPDFVVHVRHDLLEEVDGPMLKHGLQALHGRKLMKLPLQRKERPKREFLEIKFDEFQKATLRR